MAARSGSSTGSENLRDPDNAAKAIKRSWIDDQDALSQIRFGYPVRKLIQHARVVDVTEWAYGGRFFARLSLV
ncbi:hypothetical protein VSR82_26350 [Burkholderia sp. JPY481]|uniref:hypothetical protein n=1 Tax=unclassified Paraburkholderia TaxID=2615204 RepID=UPI003175D675